MGTLDTIVKNVIQLKSGFTRKLNQISETEIRKVAPIRNTEDDREDTSITESATSDSINMPR